MMPGACPNCSGEVNEYVNDMGGGSFYCLDGCGWEEVVVDGTKPIKPRQKSEHVPPRRKPERKRK